MNATVNIDIDDDTFSAHSVAGVVKKAGEKLGDGIEYIAGGAKKLYEKATSAEETDKRPQQQQQQPKRIDMHPDAEWLP